MKQKKWGLSSHGYVRTTINGKRVYLHRLIMNPPKGKVIDHKNGNKLDNRRENLRICEVRENIINQKKVGVTSKYRHVSWSKKEKKWVVGVMVNRKRVVAGSYSSEIQAAKIADQLAKRLHGEYAQLNFQTDKG